MRIMIKEEHRRRGALVIANASWLGSIALLGVIISLGGSKPAGNAPPWLGLVIIVLVGVGISASLALSRMRLAKTILKAFEVGYTLTSEEKRKAHSK